MYVCLSACGVCERAFVVVCSVCISALVKLYSPRCHSLCKRLIWPDSSIFFTVYDIIYPSNVLMIILFSLPAKGPPSPVNDEQQHTRHRLSTRNSGSKCLSPSAKCPTNISETSCLVCRCQYALTHATQHLIHVNLRQVPLF